MQRSGKSQNFGGMIRGVVDSVDGQSLIIKGQEGSSKVVLLSSSTTISKSISASSSDLSKGLNVMVRGKGNTDGSVIAESVQIFSDEDFQFRPRN